ncbi:hypothetical protein [Fluviispira sanaruensis]|uniref:Uncharacterized protein n=1 Tax=Fluviispira sanaruensis TaxID=2493639 RepID=A0A4P2VLU3_FLUSA|nr:hypothetical protein [Fluviispira sanaruensis]BBH54343.1 hypothetical protein JCM31447_28070 [Fluviispira sanaruensis]
MKLFFKKILFYFCTFQFLNSYSAIGKDVDIKKVLMSSSMNELVILANINKDLLDLKFSNDPNGSLNKEIYYKISEQNEILKKISTTLLKIEQQNSENKL